ncbi:sigma-54 interaction domain-containing protein [Thermodesulfobacteriota bacterium]
MVKETMSEWLSEIDSSLLDAFVDNPYECPIVIDKNGIVRFISRYNSITSVMSPEEAVGKHITELNKDSRLHKVLETGKAEIGKAMHLDNKQQIIARIPLKDSEGNIVGVLGKLMFHQTDKIKELYRRLEVLEGRVKYYQSEVATINEGRHVWGNIIGESEPMQKAKKLALQAASSDASVLITGESGTGKELFARAIHQKSQRADGPFIRVNCAAIPRELMESELFGYEGGAFTGAKPQGKPGKFELAQGGTILLDEIGDMPMDMQAKLLGVLQEYEIERIGGTRSLKLDFRVIAASNQDLQTLINKGNFREDLYYRLNIFRVQAPSLRDITEDIPRIAYYTLSILREKDRKAPRRISPEAMALFKKYPWPGNMRELRNVLERAMNTTEGSQITIDNLPGRLREFLGSTESSGESIGLLRHILADAEKQAIIEALRFTGGNKVKAARILGMHRTGLYQKLKRHHIDA